VSHTLTVDGLDEVIAGVARMLQLDTATREVLRSSTEKLKTMVQGDTPVGIGPTKGQLKSGWSGVTEGYGGFTFQNPVPYAAVLERGLYPGVGPRTVKTGKGIFSRQAPDGMTAAITEAEAAKIVQYVAAEIERLSRG